ncbi:MAG: iron-containing alcohol dehydrogenase, partial [Spirochaetota bacterium]
RMRSVIVKNRVMPNPKSEDIMAMVDELSGEKIDVVVGIGGGSALDSAKATAMLLSNGGDLDEYLGAQAVRKIEKKNVKLILIPTTAGTGAEVTKFGVYTARSHRKYTLNNPLLQSDVAVLVSSFTHTMPPALTAATAFDALSHALETLWNKNGNPVTDRIAVESAVAILQCMEKAYDSSVSGKTDGRREMLEGACRAGIAFNLTGTAAVHALSFILSEEWNIPHGTACAFTTEDILEYNLKDAATKKKLAVVACRLFGEASEDAAVSRLTAEIMRLKKKMAMPCRFADLKVSVSADQIPVLFERAFDDPKMDNNIVPAQKIEIYEMLQKKI